jgi:hypothetical protein
MSIRSLTAQLARAGAAAFRGRPALASGLFAGELLP